MVRLHTCKCAEFFIFFCNFCHKKNNPPPHFRRSKEWFVLWTVESYLQKIKFFSFENLMKLWAYFVFKKCRKSKNIFFPLFFLVLSLNLDLIQKWNFQIHLKQAVFVIYCSNCALFFLQIRYFEAVFWVWQCIVSFLSCLFFFLKKKNSPILFRKERVRDFQSFFQKIFRPKTSFDPWFLAFS